MELKNKFKIGTNTVICFLPKAAAAKKKGLIKIKPPTLLSCLLYLDKTSFVIFNKKLFVCDLKLFSLTSIFLLKYQTENRGLKTNFRNQKNHQDVFKKSGCGLAVFKV